MELQEQIKCAENLSQCRVCDYNSYEIVKKRPKTFIHVWGYVNIIPQNEAASCGGFKETKETTKDSYLMCGLMEGSDYSDGRIIQAANLKCFLEEFSEIPGVHEVYGGHGTFGIAIKISSLTEEMIEMFTGLEDYALVDDEVLSEMEMEEQEKAWEYWVNNDFQRELERLLDIDITDTNGDKFYELFHFLCEKANEYWFEDGCSQYIRIEPIVQECSIKLLREYEITFKEN